MGKASSKISLVILDDYKQPEYFKEFFQDKQISSTYYDSFQRFVEQEDIKKLTNVVVRYKTTQIQDGMSAIDFFNPFVKVCPFLLNKEQSMKERVIQYMRKYLLNIKLYLMTQDITNTKIPEDDQPYIKMIAQNCASIQQSLKNKKAKFSLDLRMMRLIGNLYRRVTVKIINQYYKTHTELCQLQPSIQQEIALLQQNNISYQYYNSVSLFQKSLICTNCEYIICENTQLNQIIDLRKMQDYTFSIILKQSKQTQIEQDKKKLLWDIQSNFKIILDKIKRCSTSYEFKLSQKSENTIICGNSCLYEINFEKIKQLIQYKLCNKVGYANYQKLNISYIRGYQDYSYLLEILQQKLYSKIIVFQKGQFLQNLKNKLKKDNMHFRVQIACLPDQPPAIKSDNQIIDYKINHLVFKQNFKINFEIGPLKNIHIYRPKQSTQELFTQKLALNVVRIHDQQNLKQFVPPKYVNIIDSGHIITNIQNYINQLKPLLKQYEHTYFGKIKFILFDSYDNIRSYVFDAANYSPNICFAHYSLEKIADFLMFEKASYVSLPNYKKHTLTDFDQTARNIAVYKTSSQISMASSVISTNEILKDIFKNGLKSNIDYTLQLMVFPLNEINGQKILRYYKEQYLPRYAQLWDLGYNVFEQSKNNGSKRFINFQLLKLDIIGCFNHLKSYQLLRISDEDFKNYYIINIQKCKNFIQLQITCIYILSLPHGLSFILNQIFKRPRKTQIAVKIFRPFVLVIFMAFNCFTDYKIGKVQLVSYIEDDQALNKLKITGINDIIFNSGFAFCCRNQQDIQEQDRHTIIFEFQNICFLKKSRLNNNLQIQKFSFYKQGAEYIIPPNTAFILKNILTKNNGKKLYILKQIDNNCDYNFVENVLKVNNITTNNIEEVLEYQINNLDQNQMKHERFLISQNRSLSLFKKSQMLCLLQSKINMIKEMEKGLTYYNFFANINNNYYYSAQSSLQLRIQQSSTQFSNDTQIIKLLTIQKAYLAYKMGEYSSSLSHLNNLKISLIQQDCISKQAWIIKKIDQFIAAVNMTYKYRQNVLNCTKKAKRWKIQPQIRQQKDVNQSLIVFKMKSVNDKWQTGYNQDAEKFYIEQQSHKKQESCNKIVVHQPLNQFGTIPLAWTNSQLYQILSDNSSHSDDNRISQFLKLSNTQQPKKTFQNIFTNKNDKILQKQEHKMKNSSLSENKQNIMTADNSIGFNVLNNNSKKTPLNQMNINLNKNIQAQPKKDLVQTSKSIPLLPETNKTDFTQFAKQRDLYQIQKQLNISEKQSWKIFTINDQVNIVKATKKHFHLKLKHIEPNKNISIK